MWSNLLPSSKDKLSSPTTVPCLTWGDGGGGGGCGEGGEAGEDGDDEDDSEDGNDYNNDFVDLTAHSAT